MSVDTSPWVKKAALVAAVGVSAAGLYYIFLKKSNGPTSKDSQFLSGIEKLSVKELKELGNKLFSSKKYEEAVDAFTKAIEKSEQGSEILKAMCYQNRAAAKERLGKYSNENMLEDCVEALKYNPAYGKAYLRKARLHEKLKQYHESLVDIFCAIHLDASLDKTAGTVMPLLLEEMEKIYHKQWESTHCSGERKSVRHEKVYAWLHKTVVNDPIRNDVLSWKNSGSTSYEQCLRLINEKRYDDVASVAEKENGDKKLEALILAARFHCYQNQLSEYKKCLSEFENVLSSLDEFERDAKKRVVAAKCVLVIEAARTKEDIIKAYFEAIATNLNNADFYAIAAFRLVLCGEAHEAMKILSTEGIENNDNIRLLRFTLQILTNTDGSMDMASLHNSILQLERFVNELNPKTAYSQCLLAKIYSTFGNEEMARQTLGEVLKKEPDQSIHYFDRSCMAASGQEAIEYLEKCLSLEPHHSEANLMCASLKLNELGSRVCNEKQYEALSAYVDRAQAMFDGSIDFPIIQGVFRMREVLEAKKEAAQKLEQF